MLLFVVVLVLVRNWGERERERVWVGFSVCVFVCVLGCRLRHRAYRVLQALPRVSERRRRRYCPTARPPRDMFAPAPGRKWVNHVRNYTNPCTRIYAATAMWALLLCERARALLLGQIDISHHHHHHHAARTYPAPGPTAFRIDIV